MQFKAHGYQKVILIGCASLLISCQHGNCLQNNTKADSNSTPVKIDSLERVKVYKYDGSQQCAMGKTIAIEEIQKELKDIKVFSSEKKNDGMMRIQLCGSPTGDAAVFEINKEDLPKAIANGFKEWTFN